MFREKVQSEDGLGSSAGKETLTPPVDGAVDFGGSILTGRKAAEIGMRLAGGAGSLDQTELGLQFKRGLSFRLGRKLSCSAGSQPVPQRQSSRG